MRATTQSRHHGNVIAIETFRLWQRGFEFGTGGKPANGFELKAGLMNPARDALLKEPPPGLPLKLKAAYVPVLHPAQLS